jgi:N-acetylglucosaminyldiphosphoundecaprenol N-acetyl-beta-D-mannosaminyltransferase
VPCERITPGMTLVRASPMGPRRRVLYVRRAPPPICSGTEPLQGTRKNVLGIWVNAVDYASATAGVIGSALAGAPLGVSALAVHGVMTGVLDASHRYRLNQLGLVVPDGQPVRWALNLLHGTGLSSTVCGSELTLRICASAAENDLPIYLYGSKPEVLHLLRGHLRTRFPKLSIAGAEPSRFRQLTSAERVEVIARIRASGAKITFVGLGCPRQEVWAYEYMDALSMPVIAVGAAFDFHAGLLPRAPEHLQRIGLEWLYRLLQEPRRLWRRYVLLNPAYVCLLLLQASGLRTFDPGTSIPPSEVLSFG